MNPWEDKPPTASQHSESAEAPDTAAESKAQSTEPHHAEPSSSPGLLGWAFVLVCVGIILLGFALAWAATALISGYTDRLKQQGAAHAPRDTRPA